MAFVIERIQGRYGKPVTLLRQAWREGKTIRRKTIANLTPLSPSVIEGFRTVLKGGIAVPGIDALMTIRRSYPHGHVVAVLGTAKALGFERLLGRRPSREGTLALATIMSQVLEQASAKVQKWKFPGRQIAHFFCDRESAVDRIQPISRIGYAKRAEDHAFGPIFARPTKSAGRPIASCDHRDGGRQGMTCGAF